MTIVRPTRDARSLDRSGRVAFELRADHAVVLCDSEAAAGVAAGAVTLAGDLTGRLPRYAGQPLAGSRLLVPFIGGLGDALVLAGCVNALRGVADVTVDISCPPVVHAALALVRPQVNIVPYPTPVAELARYDYFAALEGIDRLQRAPGESNHALFARRLGWAGTSAAARVAVGQDIAAACRLPDSDVPRVALALTDARYMRAYPLDLVLQLMRALVEAGVAVYLFGVGREVGAALPDAPPRLCNLIDKTPDLAALAAVIGQMDAVVCPDSLFLHLAGALRRPTIGLFTATDPAVAGGYPTVRALTAPAPCRPCGASGAACPQGYDRCVVPQEPGLGPERVAAELLAVVDAAVGQYHT